MRPAEKTQPLDVLSRWVVYSSLLLVVSVLNQLFSHIPLQWCGPVFVRWGDVRQFFLLITLCTLAKIEFSLDFFFFLHNERMQRCCDHGSFLVHQSYQPVT